MEAIGSLEEVCYVILSCILPHHEPVVSKRTRGLIVLHSERIEHDILLSRLPCGHPYTLNCLGMNSGVSVKRQENEFSLC